MNVIQCPACSCEPSHQVGTLVCLGSRCRTVLRVARAHGIDGAAVLRNRCEMWLPMAGFEERYEISSRGRVRSLCTGRILKTPCTGNDYPQVEIEGRTFRVHILLAKTFLGRPLPGRIALHHNDCKSDNRIANIRWGTYRENYADALRNGRRPLGRPPEFGQSRPQINGERRNASRGREVPAKGVQPLTGARP
jgi:NUMOD4 motif/HNH endonuclease